MKLPIILTILIICVLVGLFSNIKQTVVECNKTTSFGYGHLEEVFTSQIDGKKITSLDVKKVIVFSDNYSHTEESLVEYKELLEKYTNYLGEESTVVIDNNKVVNYIELNNNQLVLLNNMTFSEEKGYIRLSINPNTKSSSVIKLAVGDNYTDGELMQFFKNKGYSCK
jgi:hypothetical protein